MPKHWTQDQISLLLNKFSNLPTLELISIIGKSASAISIKAHKMGLKKSSDHLHFTARSYNPIGSFRVTSDGYLMKKIRDTGGNSDWDFYHRIVWIETFGFIPTGKVVCFLKGKKTSIENEINIDILKLSTQCDLMNENSFNKIYPSEIVNISRLRGTISSVIKNREKKNV